MANIQAEHWLKALRLVDDAVDRIESWERRSGIRPIDGAVMIHPNLLKKDR